MGRSSGSVGVIFERKLLSKMVEGYREQLSVVKVKFCMDLVRYFGPMRMKSDL